MVFFLGGRCSGSLRPGAKVIRYGHPGAEFFVDKDGHEQERIDGVMKWDYMHLDDMEMMLLCDKVSFLHRDPAPDHTKVCQCAHYKTENIPPAPSPPPPVIAEDFAPSPPPGTAATPMPTPNPQDFSWEFCANEGETCTCAPGSEVRFGFTGTEAMYENDGQWFKEHPNVVRWVYKELGDTQNEIQCGAASFPGSPPDPFPGHEKHCQCADSGIVTNEHLDDIPAKHPPKPPPPGMPAGKFERVDPNLYIWTHCANQGEECECENQGAYVRFGSTGEQDMYHNGYFDDHPEIRKWDYLGLPDWETKIQCVPMEFEGTNPFPGETLTCMCADRGPGDELAVAAMGLKNGQKDAKQAPVWANHIIMKRTTKIARQARAGKGSNEVAAMGALTGGKRSDIPDLREVAARVDKVEAAAKAENKAHHDWVNSAIDSQMESTDKQVAEALRVSMSSHDQSMPNVESFEGGVMDEEMKKAAAERAAAAEAALNPDKAHPQPAAHKWKPKPASTVGEWEANMRLTPMQIADKKAAEEEQAKLVAERLETAKLPPASEPIFEEGLTKFDVADLQWAYCSAENEPCECTGSVLRYGNTGDKNMYEKAARWFRQHPEVKRWAYIRVSSSRMLGGAALTCGGSLVGGEDPFPNRRKICQCGRTPAEALAHKTQMAASARQAARGSGSHKHAALGAAPVNSLLEGARGIAAAVAVAATLGVGIFAARRHVLRRRAEEHAERVVLCAAARNEFGVFYGDQGV